MINETLEANRAYQRDKDDAYNRGYKQGKADAEPHWIPVAERLPEDDVYVLLTVRRMDDSYNHVPFISTGYISWNHQCWWCAHDGNCKDANIDVLAWMPLPHPARLEKNNG